MSPYQMQALRSLALEFAADVGRLRFTLASRDSDFRIDRLAEHAWKLDGFTSLTAAQLYRETGDVKWALEVVDDHARRFARLLGEKVAR